MPLVRLTENDIEGFETFEFAKMQDSHGIQNDTHDSNNNGKNQQINPGNWFSRRIGGRRGTAGGGGGNGGQRCNQDTSEPVDEASCDSRSKRSDDDTNSVGSRGKGRGVGGLGGTPSSSNRRSPHNPSPHERGTSFNSNSSMGSGQSVPPHGNYSDGHHQQQPPIIYENGEDFDGDENDSRDENNYNYVNGAKWNRGRHNLEEDEASLSTTEDSTHQHNHHSHHQQSHQPQQHYQSLSKKHTSDGDASTTNSADTINKSSRSNSKRNNITSSTPQSHSALDSSTSSAYVARLEEQVAKLSLDLAATRATLDELTLGQRRLQEENNQLSQKLRSLEYENESLHNNIEILKKEKLILSMRRTSGVVCSVSHSDWNEKGTVTKSNDDTSGSQKAGTGGLEVPFRSSTRNYAGNDESICEEYHSDGEKEDSSHGDSDIDSVALSQSGLDQLQQQLSVRKIPQEGTPEPSPPRPQRGNFMSFIGNKSSSKNFKDDDDSSVVSTHAQDRISLIQASQRNTVGAENSGGAPVIKEEEEVEEYDEDDPFATCYPVPEGKKVEEKPRGWFQRGFKGGNEKVRSNRTTANIKRPSDIVEEDPFDTLSRASEEEYGYDENYTSFPRNDGLNSSDRSGTSGIERKGGLGLFLGRKGQQGRR
mmetsp:Transcript_24829/g.52214  ORF Transcript_24829/g.52214 Transcript_24829/m.52214 type:complete len:649 (-) Transcript_24829:101-2047(-)